MHPLRTLTLDQLRTRRSVKWTAYEPDVLPLWIAELDVPLADPVIEAVTKAVRDGDTGYPDFGAYPEALAEFTADRWDWTFNPEQASLAADVMTGVFEVLRLISQVGDPVVVNPPVYPPFFEFVAHAERSIVNAGLNSSGRLDLETLQETFERTAVGGRQVVFLLCNPHNPTGTVHTAGELAAVAELASAYGVRVIADEIHAPLVSGDEPFTPYLSVAGTENAFAVQSASKAWNLAGMKGAVIIGGAESVHDLARMSPMVSHGISHLGVIAHSAALRHGRQWLDALRADLDVNRRLLAELLETQLPQVSMHADPGTYLAWLDCRNMELDADPAEVFHTRGRVAVMSGPEFGHRGHGHVRLNYGTTPEILTEAVSRMASVLER